MKYTREYLANLNTRREMLEVAMELNVPKITSWDGMDFGTPKECLSRTDINWGDVDFQHEHVDAMRLTSKRLLTIICDHIDSQLTDGVTNPI